MYAVQPRPPPLRRQGRRVVVGRRPPQVNAWPDDPDPAELDEPAPFVKPGGARRGEHL
ncbi:hypothetical protein [Catellatospora methionotrophica]|uniref:hypothetical protein n=1 Tax=Catellatospora methionotrophica TaxID=121620 RepID=UPI00140A5C68|nr:hypothetical protein [Catellatospora methionotrophica]